MADTSLPNAPDEPDQSDGPDQICASLDSLKVRGVAPQEGDSVELQVTGTISSLDGDKAYITPETVNGQPVPEDEGGDMENPEDDLAQKAATLDSQSGY